ncbi:MAG: hypothetical protein AAB390_00455 [Patescibacteria group bacterium]
MGEKIIVTDHNGESMEFPADKIKKIPPEKMVGPERRELIIDLKPMTKKEMRDKSLEDELKNGKLPEMDITENINPQI